MVALPVLIHLINMLRHRRVQWAAMDFLLQSQKRHKKWVILKQLLLLLLRMAAIAAIAMMIAHPLLPNDLGQMFGGIKTHHIVLLDDSFSMSDRWDDTNAFARAKRVAHLLANRVKDEQNQSFSVLRFSNAPKLTPGSQPLLYQHNSSPELILAVEDILSETSVSETSAGPAEALEAFQRVAPPSEQENQIVYIVSDFRSTQWDEATELRKQLEKIERSGAAIRLVQCVDSERPNLSITELRSSTGAKASGVEMMMQVSVHNDGETTARQVAVELEENGFTRPAILIDEIPPGETVSRSFRATFPAAGYHQLVAKIAGDAVRVDNSRYYSVELPEAIPLLLIDGASDARDAYFLSLALEPGGKTKTGWKPQIEPASYLRDAKNLDSYGAIFLLNFDRLDEAAIANLENYVKSGGGVAFFLGERTRWQFVNDQLYANGKGLFPIPIRMSTDLLVDHLEEAPDLVATDHPVLKSLSDKRNPFLSMVQVERYFPPATESSADEETAVEVIARLRNGDPFILNKNYEAGRVVAVMSKASPEETRLGAWNNWVNNPSFPIAMNELAGYLSEPRRAQPERLVGQPLVVTLDSQRYRPEVGFYYPDNERDESIDAKSPKNQTEAENPTGPDDETTIVAQLDETDQSGIYEARVTNDEGEEERRLFGYNVDTGESNLAMLTESDLEQRLTGVRYEYYHADELENVREKLSGIELSDTFLYLLIGLLVIEQLLAYSAGFHPPRQEARSR